jgi:amidohydrolase
MTLKDYVIEKRRYIHQHPETGFQCEKTSAYIKNELNLIGVGKIIDVGRYSIVAVIENGEGPITGLRADFDALNMPEETDLPFKSVNEGKMHACGHDAHTAMLLGACRYLNSHKDEWSGTVKFIFQEAEEGPDPGGALAIVESGILNDCDDFYAMHVTPTIETGSLAVNYGPAMAAADMIYIDLIGRGAHAAMPDEGIDPVVMQAEYILMAQNIISRKVSPMDRAVITIAKVQAGTAFNVIPEVAELRGTVRTFNQETREKIKYELEQLAKAITERHGGSYRFKFEYGYDPVINSKESTDLFVEIGNDLLGKDNVEILDVPSAGGEDFSKYIQLKQGCMAWLGVKQKDVETYNIHHPKFNLNEDALMNGVNIFIEIIKRRSGK